MKGVAIWRLALTLSVLSAVATVPTQSAQAQTLTTLHSFVVTDGYSPRSPLIQATDGNLYGTAPEGGGLADGGTVFQLTFGGALTSLYNFCSLFKCKDGGPPDGIIQATDGDLYGTTATGGSGRNADGTAFRITTGGTLITLHSFVSVNGFSPFGGLIQAENGDFYGTAREGGANANGTVFRITSDGKVATLYSFCSQTDCTDGAAPSARLIQATDGNFYGTTEIGGAHSNKNCAYGCGTVFKITPSGALTTLYSFDGMDGEFPEVGLIQGTNRELYGTTNNGGNDSACLANGCGTIFKITLAGTLTTLHTFNSRSGANPGELIQATDGNFYGTTNAGGAQGDGTVFKITPSGKLTSLYSFCAQTDCNDGDYPIAGLVQATNGDFYGTTTGGGLFNLGSVFSLSVGLSPFAETQPTSGAVGATVAILGNNLTGATSVTFNGIAATFTVVSASEITTTVPAGATTGFVEVITPSGTLTSNTKFRVKT